MSELCLTLLCPTTLEEKLLDALLMTPEIAVFTSTPTAAHGLATGRLSAAEQVLGRALVTQVQALLMLKDREAVLTFIREQFAGTGLRYWITPVIEAGEIA